MKKIISCLIANICVLQIHLFMVSNNINVQFSNSILSVFVFLISAFFIYKYIKDIKKDKRLDILSLILGFIISFGIITGKFLEYEQTLRSFEYIIDVILFSILFAGVGKMLIRLTIKEREKLDVTERINEERISKKRFLIYFLIIFICYIPIFLAYYPTIFTYDADVQLNQMLHNDNSLHHPLIHTLFLYLSYKLGLVIGSVAIGMATHSIIQMAIMAAVFSYLLNYMHKKGINEKIVYVALAFFAIFPVNSILSLSVTKDVIFTGLFLLTFIMFFEFMDKKNITSKWEVKYIIITVLMLMFRNNAIYALLVAIPIMLLFNKERRKDWIILNLVVLVIFSGIYFSMAKLFDAKNTEKAERLCIPMQQISRVYIEKENELDDDIKSKIEKFFTQNINDHYVPHFADGMKYILDAEYFEDNIPLFLSIWKDLGIKYPAIYAEAFLCNNIGFWYIDDETHSYVYGEGLEKGQGYLLSDQKSINAKEQVPALSRLPKLKQFLEVQFSANVYRELPVISVLYNLATYFYIMMYYIIISIYEKRYKQILPISLLLAYFATMLLGPLALIRYIYPILVTCPLLIGIILKKDRFIEE